jgi:hypothetical protein
MSNLTEAVYSRWNDASLDTSICDLFWVHPMASAYGSTPEDDASKAMPRAEFSLNDESPEDHTVGHTLRVVVIKFNLWYADDVALETALDLIETTYDNSEKAGTNPLALSNGTAIRVQWLGRESGPLDENVYAGSVEFELEWQKSFNIPA